MNQRKWQSCKQKKIYCGGK